MIIVRSQIPGDEHVYFHRQHRPTKRGLQNALRTIDWVYKFYCDSYPTLKKVHIWLEYEGNVLDIEKARRAVEGEFGEWEALDEILVEVVLDVDGGVTLSHS